MRFTTRVGSVAAAAIVLGCIGGPALAAPSHATATKITVTATEFKFKLSKASLPKPGAVTFTVVNKGKLPHDFKINGKKTPMLKPGKSAHLTVTFKKGAFKYECTVPGHAAAGMKGTFKVK
ncbi:MAG TPA: cupredoxin domain-containing protein [Gaiellaceae bacterium]|nr:cupredoxin domain-containing protein [Gaiellaceae bacterium]